MLLWIVYPDEVKQTLLFKLFVRLIAGVICRDRGKVGTFVNKHDIHSFFGHSFWQFPQMFLSHNQVNVNIRVHNFGYNFEMTKNDLYMVFEKKLSHIDLMNQSVG